MGGKSNTEVHKKRQQVRGRDKWMSVHFVEGVRRRFRSKCASAFMCLVVAHLKFLSFLNKAELTTYLIILKDTGETPNLFEKRAEECSREKEARCLAAREAG